MSTSELPRPWYREVWPWLLMLPPLASVVGGVTMVYLALDTPEALVVDDYARIEEITRARYAARQRAAELGVRAVVTLDAAPERQTRVRVELAGAPSFTPPRELALKLRHAAHVTADRALVLAREAGGYAASTELAAGRYEIELGPPDGAWRLVGFATEATPHLELDATRGRE